MASAKPDPALSILDAALEAIYTSKISGARLRQVARQAGMSQGNLHYYFPTKDELYRALLDHLLEVFTADRQTILADQSISAHDKLSHFFNQQIELIGRRKEVIIFFDFWVQGTADPEIRKKISGMYSKWRADIAQVIAEGIERGEFSPENAAQVPALLASMMDGASLQFLTGENAIDLEAYFDSASRMTLGLLEKQ